MYLTLLILFKNLLITCFKFPAFCLVQTHRLFVVFLQISKWQKSHNRCSIYPHEQAQKTWMCVNWTICLQHECWQIGLPSTTPSPSPPVPSSIYPSFRSPQQWYSSPRKHGTQMTEPFPKHLKDNILEQKFHNGPDVICYEASSSASASEKV